MRLDIYARDFRIESGGEKRGGTLMTSPFSNFFLRPGPARFQHFLKMSEQ